MQTGQKNGDVVAQREKPMRREKSEEEVVGILERGIYGGGAKDDLRRSSWES